MIKYEKNFIFVLALTLLYISPSFSKNCIRSLSDIDSLKVIEKVYLHIDRDSYYAGDDIWFKAYLIDALDHLLSDHSSNLHVEMISPSSKIITSSIIRLDGGLGYGDFKLPDSISSGRYKIRAYTNYMRNFGDQLFFNKEINVINPNKSQAEISQEVKYVDKNISLRFFPEGGSLVDNVSSLVAFKASDYLGKGCNIFGKIYSSRGDLITTFKPDHDGMGSFTLTPLPSLRYYALYRGADSIEIRTELPASFPKGITLSASKNQNNEFLITVRTNPESFASLSEQDLLLNISIRAEIINTISFKIKSTDTSFVVPIEYLPEGILRMTLISREGLPLSERLAYLEREAPLKIQIETNKRIYKKREPVILKASLSEDSVLEREGNVSLAVVNENFTNNISHYPRTISSWFLLESDVRGTVEDPSYYFDPSEPDRLKNLDLLLLTQGWRDFAWKYDTIYFPSEDGFTVSGRLRKTDNKPLENSRVSIALFGGKERLVKSVPVDSTGRFSLSGIELTGEATLIASGVDKKDHHYGLLTLDSATYNPAKISHSLFVVSVRAENNQKNLASYYNTNEAIRKKYKLSDTISIEEVHVVSERHKDPQTVKVESSRLKYGTPDAELKVTENYYGFMNVLQLLKGTIPGVVVPPGESTVLIRGLGSLNYNQKPLFLIDGNPVSFEYFAETPIFLIDRIDVLKSVASTTIYGFKGFSGVINLITKAGGVPVVYKPVSYSARLKIFGYNDSRIFYSPQHLLDSKSDFSPDLRSTLFWNPDINLKGNKEVILNYFNGDNASVIRVISEGITSTGIPVTGKIEYEIK